MWYLVSIQLLRKITQKDERREENGGQFTDDATYVSFLAEAKNIYHRFVYASPPRKRRSADKAAQADVRTMANSSYTMEYRRGQEPGQGKRGSRLACGAPG